MLRRLAFPALAVCLAVYGVSAAASGSKDCASGDPNLGIEACTAFLELKGQPALNRASAYNTRGHAFEAKGDMDDAIADYGRAIGVDPKNAAAYRYRGHAYKDKGDLDRAMADYNRAIELDPKSADAHTGRGAGFEARGDLDRAIASYSRAIELDPHLALAYNGRGNCYKAKGDLDRAIADYSRAIELDPKFPYAYFNRAAAHEASKDFGKALADRAKAAELRSKENESPWRLSLAKASDGGFRGASTDAFRSLALKEAKEETRLKVFDVSRGRAAGKVRPQSGRRFASRLKSGVSREWAGEARVRRWSYRGRERFAERVDHPHRRHGVRASHRPRRGSWELEAMNTINGTHRD
jgi:tetratricopeptide (TPR) repeat protein